MLLWVCKFSPKFLREWPLNVQTHLQGGHLASENADSIRNAQQSACSRVVGVRQVAIGNDGGLVWTDELCVLVIVVLAMGRKRKHEK